MSTFRAAHYTKCPHCPDWITPGDSIVFVNDIATHENCEPSPEPWETHAPPAVERLHHLLEARDELSRYLIENNADINQLPDEVMDGVVAVMMAESRLWSLVEDVCKEHTDPRREHLADLERRIAEHERKARGG